MYAIDVCNRCHDLLMMSMNLNDIHLLNIKNANYGCFTTGTRKIEVTKLL